MDIQAIIEQQRKSLTEKLQLLTSNNLDQLFAERKQYEAKISDIDARVEHICSALGIDPSDLNKPEKTTKKERNPRMKGADIEKKIIDTIAANPNGISQMEISNLSGVTYPSVVLFLKNNPGKFSSTGERKQKRFFLKN